MAASAARRGLLLRREARGPGRKALAEGWRPPARRHGAGQRRKFPPLTLLHSSSSPTPEVQTDDNVPEGHAGLHEELYGGAEGANGAHATKEDGGLADASDGELRGDALFPLAEWLTKREGQKPCGLYAIYDRDEKLKFVGYSRNIVLAVRGYVGKSRA